MCVNHGTTDYCVIGAIDVQTPRQFQSIYRSLAKPLKLHKRAPDGFDIDFGGKLLSAGDKECVRT
jgi:hypothetical protein